MIMIIDGFSQRANIPRVESERDPGFDDSSVSY